MSVLIIAELVENTLAPAVLNAVTAAQKLGDVDVLVASDSVSAVADAVKSITGVRKVITAEAAHFANALAEEIAPQAVALAANYDIIAAASTAAGKNLLPRVAALLDVPMISDVTEVIDGDTFVHPVYAGNAFETVKVGGKKVLTFRATAFDAAVKEGGSAAVESVSATAAQGVSRFVGREVTKSERPELTQASIIVSGGRGTGSKENFESVLTPLADKLGAAIGASRAAVDSGYAPNDLQVGQTGKIVAPELYIACGISGAIQHLAGMQDSKVIVAINKDPEAPIFNVATYGLVADLFEAVPELVKALS
ncbi:MAG: electron transfer flavoprotein subunit alpha/FixB family protein [Neisseriaceae bacterium]|nr:electron transfer flavoprotein subunit alpha/FixB family protein [Neisseriaceae bacterium]MBO7381067.1 electron transfer flavoprotein subunit alpha/FixB family protein [Neisseriaceae bacterium]